MVASLSAAPRHTNPSLWLLKKTTTVSYTLIYKALEEFTLIKQVINQGLIESQTTR